MSEKACTSCGVTYPATPEYFNRSNTGRDGLRSVCKACQSAYYARYASAHSDRLRDYRRGYRAMRREALNAQARGRYNAKKSKMFARRLGRTA